MQVELWIVSDHDDDQVDQRIPNVTVVPPVGATLDTLDGTREVHSLHYDYAPDGSALRVHVKVRRLAHVTPLQPVPTASRTGRLS